MKEKETYWSRFAGDFEERNAYVVGKSDMEAILDEVSKVTGLKNTLELACGNGTYSKVLSKNADKVTVTDFSDEMVDAAKKRLSGFENVSVEKADAFDLQYPENSFDTVFLANLLHVVPNPENIVDEVKKVLKTGGRTIVLDFGVEGMSLFDKTGMMLRYLKTYGKPPSDGAALSTEDIKRLLEEAGFTVEGLSLIGRKSKAAFAVASKK